MFDLTNEVSLDLKSQKLYRFFQFALYTVAFFSAIYLSYLIIFPHKNFSFSFLNPTSNQNNTSQPHLANGENFSSGYLAGGEKTFFDTTIDGEYSSATVSLTVDSSFEKPNTPTVSVRKSYQAFMYNLGGPIGFRDGSLLENSGNYYIISNSTLRKFSNPKIFLSMGYTKENFKTIPSAELIYNQVGSDISSEDIFPDGTIFKIADNYYILEADQKLKKFVSDQAYLTRYDSSQAIDKDADFLNKYQIENDLIGFADGTLVSSGDSVFIISDGKNMPIDNPLTFTEKGYNWNDILNIGEDEMAIYQKDKLFNIKSPHPNGTIFKTSENSTYYMIANGEKHILPGVDIAASWTKKTPVIVSENALKTYAGCDLKKEILGSSTYSCQIPLDKFTDIIGFDYEFKLSSQNDLKMNSVSVDYRKNVSKANLKSFILGIYNSIKSTYVPVE